MAYWGYPEYVPVATRRAKAERKIKQLMKKDPNIQPVIIDGAIAKTWWGKAWNKNLSRYADYSNRVGRGRSYVRNLAVVDLQIKKGEVTAKVQGTSLYRVSISIAKMSGPGWKKIIATCKGKFDSVQKILKGKFPKALETIFTEKNKGVFPSPKEIQFSCSCPDSAYMCKHVAATLFGIGARLDHDPAMFFTLRNIDIKDLISENIKESKKALLKKAKVGTAKSIKGQNLSDIFGIDLEEDISLPEKKIKAPAPAKRLKKGNSPSIKPEKRQTLKKASTQKAKKNTKKKLQQKLGTRIAQMIERGATKSELVLSVVRRTKNGTTAQEIAEKTGLQIKDVRNCIYRLKKLGEITPIGWGVFVKGK